MPFFPELRRAGSRTAKLFLPVAVALVMLLGSAGRMLGQALPLITEFGFSDPGIRPNGVVVADFNGDGIPDVATVNFASSIAFVSVYVGKSDGTFQLPVNYFPNFSTYSFASFIVAADLNGDGKVDLCVGTMPDNNVWVLLGVGDGTFQSPVSSSLTSTPYSGIGAPQFLPFSITVADFSGDGKPDIAVSGGDTNSENQEMLLLPGNGDGTFAPGIIVYDTNALYSNTPQQIVTADFNGDGKPDIAMLTASYSVAVLLGSGSGEFSNPVSYPVGSIDQPLLPTAMVVGDFNGDGIPDLAVATYNSSSIQVFLGNGDGTFGQAVVTTFAAFVEPPAGTIAAADFNGDGHLDLMVGGSNNLLLLGNGDGTFQTPSQLVDGFGANTFYVSGVAAADLNGDHKPDVVLVNSDGPLALVSVLNTTGTAGAAMYPFSYDFGVQVAGVSSPTTTVTIGNPGTSAMTFSNLAVSDTTDFSATSNCGSSVAPGADCAITIAFTPQTIGGKTASVTFNTNDPLVATGKIALTGNIILPVLSESPAELQFSYQKVGTTSAPQTFEITNTGVGPLEYAFDSEGDFQNRGPCPQPLPEGATCTRSVTFSPLVPGSETGRIVFTNMSTGTQSAMSLTGIGYVVGPSIAVSPSTFDFGSQYVGTSGAPSVVTVQNNGDAPFTISSVAATAGFTPLNTCGNSVQPGFSCAIGIFFDPATTGSQTGTLTITDNLSSSPQTVALTGTGTAITVGASSDSSTAQTFSGGKAAYQMSIAPVAGYSGTVNLSCVGLAAGYSCALSSASAVLSGSAPTAVTVTVSASTTTADGSQRTPASGALGRLALACPIALIFLGAGIYPRWRRRFLAIGLVAVAAAFTSSCGGTSAKVGSSGSSQTYVFFLQAQPASGITIDTPLTLTVPSQ